MRGVLAEDNTLLREVVPRLIKANGDPELAGVGTDRPEQLALIATNLHDALLVAGQLAAEGFFGPAGAKNAAAWDGPLARRGQEPHVTIATASLVRQR